jgi:MFS family permease
MRKASIYLIAFICGFTLMSFEILGSRVLAPHFGQSIYVWGALISVLLAALGIGNYYGGIMADRHGGFVMPSFMTALCAAYFFVTPWLGSYVCWFITFHIDDPRLGVLLAAAAIFWLPAFCLGTITPSLVKLLISDLKRLGRGSGHLLGISTAGNIAGTLLTAFFLIGRLPTGLSIQLLTIPMVLCSVLCLLLQYEKIAGGITVE